MKHLSLLQRNHPGFLVTFYQQTICDITAKHILFIILQDMAAANKNIQKLKKCVSISKSTCGQSSNSKIMLLSSPPSNFLENESVANISNVLTTRNHAEVLPHQKKHFKGNNVSSLGKKNTRKEQDKYVLKYLIQQNAIENQKNDEDDLFNEINDENAVLNNEMNDEDAMSNNEMNDEDAMSNDEINEKAMLNNEINIGHDVLNDIINEAGDLNVHNAATCCDKCREERKDFESLVLNKLNELLEIAHSNPVEHQVRKI